MLELVHLTYSPWSERARWALDHHGIKYRSTPYVPMVGALPLRLRLGRFTGRVTVPVLFTPHGNLTDSTDIARHADRVGKGAPLLPREHEDSILDWVKRCDRAFEAGRNLVTRRTGRSATARKETLPPPLRRLGPLGDAIAKSGVRYFVKKYDLDAHDESRDLADASEILVELRKRLAGRPTLLEAFSYADIVASGILQIVEPVRAPSLPMGRATREVWGTPELARSFADLVEWRDDVYAKYRPGGPSGR